jgi:hypothetical protein
MLAALGAGISRLTDRLDRIEAHQTKTAALVREIKGDKQTFRAGDTVAHAPSGEEWILANDEENGRVFPCGWPETMAEAKDCRLLKAADDDARLWMLHEWAKKENDMDTRIRTARRQLEHNDAKPTRRKFRPLDLPNRIQG